MSSLMDYTDGMDTMDDTWVIPFLSILSIPSI